MAPAVLLEYTRDKPVKRSSQYLNFQIMGKSQKFSRKLSSGVVLDYHHAEETVGETEDFEDSSAPKRKVMSLNASRSAGFNIPLQVIALSKMSSIERKDLESRLQSELDQIKSFQKMMLTKNIPVAVSSSSNSKIPQNASNLKRSATGFESNKKAAPTPPPAHVSNSYAMLMKQCAALLKRLMSHQYGWVFNDPVDVVKLNIPDYFTVIKHPMDLGTIKSKLASGAYADPWGFVADVRLTFTNAMTYNSPGNDVHLMADVLSKFFETSWKPIEKKLVAADLAAKKFLEASTPKELAPHTKKQRLSPPSNNVVVEEVIKPKITDEEKRNLSSQLESLLGDLPDHIIEFLRRHSDNGSQSCEDEIEIDIDSLSNDTLVELRRHLDEHLQENQTKGTKVEPWEVEIINEPGLSNSSVHPFKGNELAEEEVDIGGNDLPMSSYPPIEIEKDTVQKNSKGNSSSRSGSDSSSSSDSDSASSSGSESDVGGSSPPNTSKENVKPLWNQDQERSVITNPPDINRSVTSDHSEQGVIKKLSSVEVDGHPEGENAPSERQVSPEKQYRAALLRSRFADTILKAREKTLDKSEKADPERLRRERDELERQKREDRARLQAEAKAAEEARRKLDAEAAAEGKRKRELEREAARQALLKMEKTVEINENSLVLKDLEMLRTEHIPSSVGETSPDLSQDAIGGFKLGGSNPLEQLGLFMKVDDEEEDEGEPANIRMNDVEEGEID